MFKKIFTAVFACAAVGAFAQDIPLPDDEEAAPATVDALVELVLRNNPGLHGLAARARAMEAVPPQARALPDPMLALGLRGGEMWMQSQPGVEAEQSFPFPGKRALRGEAAGTGARRAHVEHEAGRLALEEEARRLAFDIIYFDRAEAIIAESRAYLERMRDHVRIAYAAGRASQSETFRAEAAVSEVREQDVMVRQRREAAGSLLQCCLGAPADAPAPWRRILPPADISVLKPLEEIEILAKEHSPAMEIARTEQERSGTLLRLARKEFRPDFVVRGEYWPGLGSDPSEWMAFFGLSVPLYAKGKQHQAVVQAREELTAGEWNSVDVELTVIYDIREAYAMALRARETYLLYRDTLVPQTEAVLSAAEISYGTGRTDFDAYVQAFLDHLRTKMREAEEFSEHEKQAARLKLLAGADVRQKQESGHE